MNSQSRNPRRAASAGIIVAPALALALSVGMAQNFTVEGRTTAGGGGVSSGGPFSVSGTSAGQSDTGNSSGGPFSTEGGFWVIVSVLQTPDAPPIAFRHVAGVQQVFWPLPADGWVLESSPNLTSWADVPPASYQTDGVNRFYPVPQTNSIRFFRLHRPPPPTQP